MTEDDKSVELHRYDSRALSQINGNQRVDEVPLGSKIIPAYLSTPYIFYEQKIAELIQPNQRVLELGAGSGLHTLALIQTGAQITASDISPNSLKLLKQKFKNVRGNLRTEVADIESLPFDDASFDVIAIAGSLSYGDPYMVDAEIKRVLRPGGMFICVDSLNHNPIYCANRWIHYMRGNRTKSTLKRMPDLARIRSLGHGFSGVNVRFFGSISYAMPVVARLIGDNLAQTASDRIDQFVSVRRSAFKFVLVAQGLA